jgi:chromosome segregation ATPase
MTLIINPSTIGIFITILGTIITFIIQHNKHKFKIDNLSEKIETLENKRIAILENKIEKIENHNIDMKTAIVALETKMNVIENTINEIRTDIKLILKNQVK